MVKALVADDSPIMRKIIKTNLQKAEVRNVKEAKDGKETLTILNLEDDINLLFLDINMPELDGKEVIKELKAKGKLSKIKIVIISTELNDSNKEDIEKYNITDFIPKPFNLKAFEEIALPIIEMINNNEAFSDAIIEKETVVNLFKEKPEAGIKGDEIVMKFSNQTLKVNIDSILTNAKIVDN